MAAYPSALATFAGFTATHTLAADNHAAQHNLEQGEILAVQTKVGTGSSTPTANKLLRATGTGVSSWGQADLTTDVTGILPVGSGGIGQNSLTALPLVSPAISGTVSGGATYTNPTITTPTIASFVNANHDHSNAAGGGILGTNSVTTNAITDASVTSRKAALTIIGAEGSTLNPIPTSETDLTNSSQTFTLATASYALITATCTIQANTTGDFYVYLNVDGTNDGRYLWAQGQGSAAPRWTCARTWRLTLTAGSHTIKMRTVASGAVAGVAYDPTWWGIVVSQ